MRALLDAQPLIYHGTGDPRLPPAVRRQMDDPSNQLVLSVASTWEMVIKASTGRLRLDRPALAYIEHYITLLSLEILPVTLQHAFAVAPLPSHHGDPFDRMLVAQATIEGLPIITGDMAIRHYDIETIW